MSDERKTFEGWAILELMGHVKLGGFVTETTLAGAGVLRIDIPSGCSEVSDHHCPIHGDCTCPKREESKDDDKCPLHSESSLHNPVYATQFINPSSLYRMTPCSEEAARAIAAHNRPQPVASWALPRLPHREEIDPDSDDEIDVRDRDDLERRPF